MGGVRGGGGRFRLNGYHIFLNKGWGCGSSEIDAFILFLFSTSSISLKTVRYKLISEHHFFIDTRKHSAKGITKETQWLLTHEKYSETLASGNLVRAENTRIISERHILNTVRANKIALSAYDDKRYILSDGISTLPYGHYRTVNASIFPDSNQDDDDDDRDYPLAPTMEVVQKDWLSRYQSNISEQMKNNENCGPTIVKVKKLLQTLHDKTHYIFHHKLLKLYVKLGLIVTKLYRIVKFKQELWLEQYITLNTNKRKAAKNKFEEALYKLLINSIYGKMCESKRKRMKIRILRDAEETIRNISKFEF